MHRQCKLSLNLDQDPVKKNRERGEDLVQGKTFLAEVFFFFLKHKIFISFHLIDLHFTFSGALHIGAAVYVHVHVYLNFAIATPR
jgi:hypothetical protein